MRAVLQRVSRAEVRIDGQVVGRIGPGLMILLGVGRDDTTDQAAKLAEKTTKLRLFPTDKGEFDADITEIGGQVLAVSQFTLHAETKKGRRPSFSKAAPPGEAEPLYQAFIAALEQKGLTVARGRFGAMMEVDLVNDGPVTILLDTDNL